jgi:predicted transcriptional regulator
MMRLSADERILLRLCDGPATTAWLEAAVGMPTRSIRRRLRRLIRDGYVFSPARGSYRLTMAGRRAVERA